MLFKTWFFVILKILLNNNTLRIASGRQNDGRTDSGKKEKRKDNHRGCVKCLYHLTL